MDVKYIAVESTGGIIDTVIPGTDLRQMILDMHKRLDDDFSHESDDARIFDTENKEVYAYQEPDTLEIERNGVFWCGTCNDHWISDIDDAECPTCHNEMELLISGTTAEEDIE